MTARRRKKVLFMASLSLWVVFFLYFLWPEKEVKNGGYCKDFHYRGTASRNHFPRAKTGKRCRPNKNKTIFKALLSHWDILSKHHNITYVIGLGSLLGQYRTQDIIPWDNDVDVLVDVKDFKILKRLALGEKRNFMVGSDNNFHFVVQPEFDLKDETKRRRWSCYGKRVSYPLDKCSFVSPMARVILGFKSMDIFPYIDKGSVVHDVEMKKSYGRKDFFPFQRCNFMSISTWCPNNIPRVLESAYEKDLQPEYTCRDGVWIRRKKLYQPISAA